MLLLLLRAWWCLTPWCELYVGAGGAECAMSWSQCSLLSTGHSAREFLWAEWESFTLCPLVCPLKTTVIFNSQPACLSKFLQENMGKINCRSEWRATLNFLPNMKKLLYWHIWETLDLVMFSIDQTQLLQSSLNLQIIKLHVKGFLVGS